MGRLIPVDPPWEYLTLDSSCRALLDLETIDSYTFWVNPQAPADPMRLAFRSVTEAFDHMSWRGGLSRITSLLPFLAGLVH